MSDSEYPNMKRIKLTSFVKETKFITRTTIEESIDEISFQGDKTYEQV